MSNKLNVTEKDFRVILADFYGDGLTSEEFIKILNLEFKEPEIELIDGEYYLVKTLYMWHFLKYRDIDDCFVDEVGSRVDVKEFEEIRTLNNPPKFFTL